MGTLVSRTAVITACVCVANPEADTHDTRSINVVTGAMYRHPRRGIRVQVTKIILPKLPNVTAERAYIIQKSPAIMLLAKNVPDVLAEVPLRPITVDFKGDEVLALHEECIMPGWHFFYKGDKIYPVQKFLLQRNIRVQYLVIAKKNLWCNTITLKFQQAMTNLGFDGLFDKTSSICVKDVSSERLPVGYIEEGRIFGLFEPEFHVNWEAFIKNIDNHHDGQYDYLPDLYDRMLYQESDSSEEVA
ncbi:unnamed protein product, partial [Brenthis ino]